jgi:hypothetical protein
MNVKSLSIVASLLFLLNAPALAQRAAAANQGGDVLMLEEIRIQVAPELPTVVVTIPRQRPAIQAVALKESANEAIAGNPIDIKPRLSDLRLNRIEEPQKILAKDRAQ